MLVCVCVLWGGPSISTGCSHCVQLSPTALPCVVQDIVVGRHRDTEDRISWFLGAGQFEAALAIAEADRSLPTAVYDTVVQVGDLWGGV